MRTLGKTIVALAIITSHTLIRKTKPDRELRFQRAKGGGKDRNRYAAEGIIGELRPVEIELTKWRAVVEG